jgi:hypothetical protein
MTDAPDFKTWSRERLEEFVTSAYTKMIAQQETIANLRHDLKDAIRAYRDLIIQHEKEKQNDDRK